MKSPRVHREYLPDVPPRSYVSGEREARRKARIAQMQYELMAEAMAATVQGLSRCVTVLSRCLPWDEMTPEQRVQYGGLITELGEAAQHALDLGWPRPKGNKEGGPPAVRAGADPQKPTPTPPNHLDREPGDASGGRSEEQDDD
jgi:hypothetical protein